MTDLCWVTLVHNLVVMVLGLHFQGWGRKRDNPTWVPTGLQLEGQLDSQDRKPDHHFHLLHQ